MPTVKRVFSITDKVSNDLNPSIPNQKRSKFVTRTIAEALEKRNWAQLVNTLDKLEPWRVEDSETPKSVVEVI